MHHWNTTKNEKNEKFYKYVFSTCTTVLAMTLELLEMI